MGQGLQIWCSVVPGSTQCAIQVRCLLSLSDGLSPRPLVWSLKTMSRGFTDCTHTTIQRGARIEILIRPKSVAGPQNCRCQAREASTSRVCIPAASYQLSACCFIVMGCCFIVMGCGPDSSRRGHLTTAPCFPHRSEWPSSGDEATSFLARWRHQVCVDVLTCVMIPCPAPAPSFFLEVTRLTAEMVTGL